jgi:hypothetical protein
LIILDPTSWVEVYPMTYFTTAAGVFFALGLNIASVNLLPASSATVLNRVNPTASEDSAGVAAQSPTMWVLLGTGLALVNYAGSNRNRDAKRTR